MSTTLPANKRYFPSGIATGEAFCNRDHLRAQLWTHIQEGTDTVIMAPRRYGKSSLMTQVLLENHCRYGWVDFLSCANESAVQDKLLKCIAKLTERLTSGTSKLQKVLQHFFDRMRPEIILLFWVSPGKRSFCIWIHKMRHTILVKPSCNSMRMSIPWGYVSC